MPDPKFSAYETAVRLLGIRDHSRFELHQKLSLRGHEDADIACALARLEDHGYLDDRRFAEILMRQYSDLGRLGLSAQMTKRGIAEEIWREMVNSIDSDEEYERALDVAKQKAKTVPPQGPERTRWRARTAAFLGRRGFSTSVMMSVLSALEREADDDSHGAS